MERALQHIEDARVLSEELGGTDKDVKAYFFSLRDEEMGSLLEEYATRYGDPAREYAVNTLGQWKSGRVKMSGTVAERLFNLLPPRMPIGVKYKLTENLWEHFGPKSKKRLRIGLDADLGSTVEAVQAHFEEVVLQHRIPDQLERRFNWLASGDVEVKQHLLNHLRSQERLLLSEGARLQLPVMIDHLKQDDEALTTRVSQMLKIGKHELELLIDPDAEGCRFEEWTPPTRPRTETSSGGGINWGFLIIAALLIWALAKCSGQ
jgi:hypothetical protein